MSYFVQYMYLEENKIYHLFGFFLVAHVCNTAARLSLRCYIMLQAYTSTALGEGKEAITWARFEYGDINDPTLYPDSDDDRNSSPPLLLVLGYGSGVQVRCVTYLYVSVMKYCLYCSLCGSPRIKNALCCVNEHSFQAIHISQHVAVM